MLMDPRNFQSMRPSGRPTTQPVLSNGHFPGRHDASGATDLRSRLAGTAGDVSALAYRIRRGGPGT